MCKVRKKILLSIMGCLLIFNWLLAFGLWKYDDSILPSGELDRLTKVITVIKNNYYKVIDYKALFTRAISSMLESLDPHSSYLDKEALTDLRIMTWGKFGGVGIEFILEKGLLKVISPLDDTPAYKAGIKSGDILVQINGKFVRDLTIIEATNMLRGNQGSLVKLTIIRKNENKPLIFNLRREIIKIKTVKEKMLEPGYWYIRLAQFQEPTEKDMVRAIEHLQKASKNGLKGLVLDIRDNSGGLVESAIQIADDFLNVEFLKGNDLIVYAKGQDEQKVMVARATPGNMLPRVPMVVLINEGSASAAEIVAGALQDHKRAIVVGTRSFGKGSMQTIIPVGKDAAIKLTTALYYTPFGRSIQAKGIEPDINVENIQLANGEKLKQDISKADETSLMSYSKNDDNETQASDIERQRKRSKGELALAYKDYQLYEALHILKSQNVMRSKIKVE